MDPWSTVAGVLILLVTALVLGSIFEWLKQSAILGYLLAGTIIGPNALNLVRSGEDVLILAELGVALLLFTIGLEFSWRRLRSIGPVALGLGLLQIGLTIPAATAICLMFGLSTNAAIVLGSALMLSSTACVLRVLVDRAEIESVHGRLALAILLLQDLAVVVLVLLTPMLSGTHSAEGFVQTILLSLGLIVGMVVVFFVANRLIISRLFKANVLTRNRELPVLLAVAVALGSAWGTQAIGLSPVLGAFLAGMLLGESAFAVQIRADVGPLRSLFVTLFFTSIGMLGDPAWMLENLGLVAAVVAAILIGKTIIIAASGWIMRLSLGCALATGLSLAQVGEFSFVLAAEAYATNLFSEDLFNLLVTATIATLFLTPYLVAPAARITSLWPRAGVERQFHDAHAERFPRADHVVVVGYGPAGEGVSRVLHKAGVPTVVVELNPRHTVVAEQEGLIALVGDARAAEILRRVHITGTRGVVITVPSHQAIVEIIRQVRAIAPGLPIIARSRYHLFVHELTEAGAEVVIDEEQQMGERLGAAVLPWLDTDSEEVGDENEDQTVDEPRQAQT